LRKNLRRTAYITGRPYSGLYSIDINSYLAARMYNLDNMGVYVQAVDPNSPAEIAGLRAIDLIKKIDGVAITEANQVTEIMKTKK
jgi:S1-C subfamily serine protease